MKKTRVLFVCLGNICRSPLAEAIFVHKTKLRNLQSSYESDSCGTSNYHIGDPPDHRTVRNAAENGVQIVHSGRQITANDLETFDYVLVMDQSNLTNVKRLPSYTKHQSKIRLMRDFDSNNPGADVPDPYYRGEDGFQEVFTILERTVENFLDHLEEG